MAIALRNYQAFDMTKAVFEFGRTNWKAPRHDCIDLSRKVGSVVLAILGILPALLLDLLLYPIALAYRACYPAPETTTLKKMDKAAPPPKPKIAQKGEVPGPELVERLNGKAYPNGFPEDIPDADFFRDALRWALSFHPADKQNYLKGLIEDDDGVGDVNIYQHSAQCLIAFWLFARAQALEAVDIFPGTEHLATKQELFGNEEDERRARNQASGLAVKGLWRLYKDLTPEERASVLLQAIDPDKQWQLTAGAKKLVQGIQERALDISQIKDYLTGIYKPVADHIQNI